MAGKVLNIKFCSPLKLHSGLIGKYHTICHYSYNLPLACMQADTQIAHLPTPSHVQMLQLAKELFLADAQIEIDYFFFRLTLPAQV